jgi:hypothetical protein
MKKLVTWLEMVVKWGARTVDRRVVMNEVVGEEDIVDVTGGER